MGSASDAWKRSPTKLVAESMASIVRTEICVPAGIVRLAGFASTIAPAPGSSGSKPCGCGAGAFAALSESNLSETMSATLYFCTVDPTWKLISASVPPRNLPLIRLPFLNCNVSGHAIDAARVRTVRNPHFSLSPMVSFPFDACLVFLVVIDCLRGVYRVFAGQARPPFRLTLIFAMTSAGPHPAAAWDILYTVAQDSNNRGYELQNGKIVGGGVERDSQGANRQGAERCWL